MKQIIEALETMVYKIPTDGPEADGTLDWDSTTMVLVRVRAAGVEGLGYTYGNGAIGKVIASELEPYIRGRSVMDVPALQEAMIQRIRNDGQCGLGMMAVSAVDIALWDLKAKLLGLPLCALLGQYRNAVAVYGSGGFTSYSDAQLRDQLKGWASMGLPAVKIKVGRDDIGDIGRVKVAREVIGRSVELYVDANGAYTVSDALRQAEQFAKQGVSWLEEPVVATAVSELRFIRERMPAGMRVVAGEYGYGLSDFRPLLEKGAVDVLQADATRCGGITGFLKAGTLAEVLRVPLSSHCAPAIHLHAALAVPDFLQAEYFHDHVRIEQLFFDGVSVPQNGRLCPGLTRAGHGLELREEAVASYRAG